MAKRNGFLNDLITGEMKIKFFMKMKGGRRIPFAKWFRWGKQL